jgi:hypothetical protein
MKNRPVEQAEKRRKERGSVLATSAIAMMAVLLAVGLGIDVSRLYLTQTELQNAADASALAGVSGLNGHAQGINDAVFRATNTFNKYEFNKTGVQIDPANVLFSVNLNGPYISQGAAAGTPVNIRFVKVTTPEEPVGMSFAALVLGKTKNLSATATAGFSVTVNMLCPWLPAFVLDDPAHPIAPGSTYTFRLAPGSAISPGNYQLLAPVQSGGSGDREGMATGVNWCISVGTTVKTKPGVTAGAIRQGINTRFDVYAAGMDPGTYPPDKNIAENITYDAYANKSDVKEPSHTGVDGRRVVFIPIAAAPPEEGRDEVTVTRFGVFFLKSSVGGGSGGELQAEYITDTIFAGESYFAPGAGPGIGGAAVPVLYR